MKNKEGWDGKLRVEPKAVITNPEALEDSDYSDPEAPPVEEIDADEGKTREKRAFPERKLYTNTLADLLAEEDPDVKVCDQLVVYFFFRCRTAADESLLHRISTWFIAAYHRSPRYDWNGSPSFKYVHRHPQIYFPGLGARGELC